MRSGRRTPWWADTGVSTLPCLSGRRGGTLSMKTSSQRIQVMQGYHLFHIFKLSGKALAKKYFYFFISFFFASENIIFFRGETADL
jgi:CRISPR/Cas system Type II protein with McrA/HNH and RuvC-like nuclease domain